MKTHKPLLYIICLAGSMFLIGCGVKGDLTLPEQQNSPQKEAAANTSQEQK